MKSMWNPGMLLDVSGGYWRGCVLQAAVRMAVFSEIGDSRLNLEEIHEKLDVHKESLGLLLDALVAMKLLDKENETYQNLPEAARFLDRSSPDYMGHIILHHHHLLDGWAQLDQAITTGNPPVRRSYGEEVERESFLMGMFNLASLNAPRVVEAIDLRGRKRLLDLGGGPGTYAIHFCRATPGLEAVIYDRPTTEVFARKTVEKFGLGERITFRSGDFTRDPITGGPYDVAWLSHVLHSNPPGKCFELIRKTVAAMEPGGLLLIHDFILDNSKTGPEFPALFSLNMLLAGNGGRSYSEEEIFEMMRAAGVVEPARHDFRSRNDSGIVCGTIG